MKICVFSDIHGYLPDPNTLPEVELILIAGDVIPLAYQSNPYASKKWFIDKFSPWANSLHCNKVLFIAGNHDFYCEDNLLTMKELFPDDNKVTFLQDELYIHLTDDKMYTIYGTPWCKQFGNWAYMKSQDELLEKWEEVPPSLDILLTHDAPYGTSDLLMETNCWWYTKDHIGNPALRQIIKETHPRYNFHGHLHSTNHECEMLDETKIYNVSLLSEQYEPIYEPLILDI